MAAPDGRNHDTLTAPQGTHSFHSQWAPVPTLGYSSRNAKVDYLGPTIVTKRGQPVDVKIVNALPAAGTEMFGFGGATPGAWAMRNHSPDSHPIHEHLTELRLVGRWPVDWDPATINTGKPVALSIGKFQPPGAFESGPKDTFVAPTNAITVWVGKYTIGGKSVWHCHILSHEDVPLISRQIRWRRTDRAGDWRPARSGRCRGSDGGRRTRASTADPLRGSVSGLGRRTSRLRGQGPPRPWAWMPRGSTWFAGIPEVTDEPAPLVDGALRGCALGRP